MPIWTSSRSVAALLLLSTVAACGVDGAGFGSQGFFLWSGSANTSRRNVALRSADLASGALRLIPPDGFCVDRRALEADFAVLARCDSLGSRRGGADAPLGMLTVAVARADTTIVLSEALPATFPDGAKVLAEQGSDTLVLAQIEAVPAARGTDAVYWRGLSRIGDYVLSFAAYAPDGGSLAGDAGAATLRALDARMRAASAINEVPPASEPVAAPPRTGLLARLGGLLNRDTSVE